MHRCSVSGSASGRGRWAWNRSASWRWTCGPVRGAGPLSDADTAAAAQTLTANAEVEGLHELGQAHVLLLRFGDAPTYLLVARIDPATGRPTYRLAHTQYVY
jgi:hypothetical protein